MWYYATNECIGKNAEKEMWWQRAEERKGKRALPPRGIDPVPKSIGPEFFKSGDYQTCFQSSYVS